MTKLIASLGALLVFVCLGAASAGGDIRQEPLPLHASAPFGVEALARAEVVEVAASDTAAVTPMGEMSAEEKERRREVCRKAHDQCYDQCTRFYANNKNRDKLKPCYKRCADDIADCMKAIPN